MLIVSEILKKNHFVTTEAVETVAEADIEDSIKRKRIRVSFKYCTKHQKLGKYKKNFYLK